MLSSTGCLCSAFTSRLSGSQRRSLERAYDLDRSRSRWRSRSEMSGSGSGLGLGAYADAVDAVGVCTRWQERAVNHVRRVERRFGEREGLRVGPVTCRRHDAASCGAHAEVLACDERARRAVGIDSTAGVDRCVAVPTCDQNSLIAVGMWVACGRAHDCLVDSRGVPAARA